MLSFYNYIDNTNIEFKNINMKSKISRMLIENDMI